MILKNKLDLEILSLFAVSCRIKCNLSLFVFTRKNHLFVMKIGLKNNVCLFNLILPPELNFNFICFQFRYLNKKLVKYVEQRIN